MDIDPVVVLLGHVIRIEAIVPERIGLHDTGRDSLVDLQIELFDGSDAYLLLAVFGAPYRQRGAPETASAEIPVLDILQPLTETARTGGFRLPGDLLVQVHHLILYGRSLDEPGIERIIEDRLVGTPAVRIAVDVLLDLEAPSVLLHHHAQVDVQGRSIGRQRIVEGILDVPA